MPFIWKGTLARIRQVPSLIDSILADFSLPTLQSIFASKQPLAISGFILQLI